MNDEIYFAFAGNNTYFAKKFKFFDPEVKLKKNPSKFNGNVSIWVNA